MIEFITAKNDEEMGGIAASMIAQAIGENPQLVLGLATGSSPLSLYGELIRLHRDEALDFSGVRTVNLDEYAGLPADHPQSYRYFMDTNLFNHINIDPANTHLPDGNAQDLGVECARYDGLVEGLGGIDVQVLGIGGNGHIGFNEPSDRFSNHTLAVSLAQDTIEANSRFFESPDEVPRQAITLDIKHIMQAKKIVLVAFANKKEILEKALYGDITAQVPASVLQLHQDVTAIICS
ncbi:MAG: glucosamine-6-phosphate deaminase [Clostridiales bacterium]|nr:glucosamine-6-phosphate deaminase [Clostridiales bacterium]